MNARRLLILALWVIWGLAVGQSLDLSRVARLRTLEERLPYLLAFNPQGTVLATSDRYAIRLWEVSSGRTLRTLQETQRRISALAFSADGKTLVTVLEDGTIKRWEAASGKILGTRSIGNQRLLQLALSPDGSRLATAGYGEAGLTSLKVWDSASGRELRTLGIPSREQYYAIAISPDGRYLAALQRGLIKLWDIKTGNPGPTLGDGRTQISGMAFSPDSTRLAALAYGRGSVIKVWGIADAQELANLQAEGNDRFASLAWSRPDGRIIATALYDGTVQLWDASGTPLRSLQVTERIAVSGLSFSPDGRRLATSFQGGTTLWGTANAAVVFAGGQAQASQPAEPAKSPAGPRPGNVFAVVVGISNYKFVGASLTYAFSDARKVAAAFKDPSKGNLPPDQVLLRGDDEATKNVIEADLRELARRMKAGDTLVFYFSGHGMPGSDGQAKLIPADAKPSDEETWLGVAEVQATVQKASAGQGRLVMILDSCFSGQAEEGSRSFALPGQRAVPQAAPPSATEQSTVLASSDGTQPSWEEAQFDGGVFTYQLLQALSGKGDANGDGYLTLAEAYAYLAPRVEEYSKSKGKPQTPKLRGSADFALGANANLLAQKTLDQRQARLGGLKRENKISGEQFDALVALVGAREPEDLTAYLGGQLAEPDFLLLVGSGAIAKVPPDKTLDARLLKLGSLRSGGKLRREQFLKLAQMVKGSSGPPDLWDFLAGRLSEAQFLTRLKAGAIPGVER